MDLSFVKLYRKSIDSTAFKNPHLWQVWTYCLMRANYKSVKVQFEGEEIILKPGEFITGIFKGATDCNMKPSTFRDQLTKLKKMNAIDIKSDNKKSIISVRKWNFYQYVESEPDSKHDRQSDTNTTTTRHRQEYKKYNNNNESILIKYYEETDL
jgi:hypothetical protein